MLAHLQRAAVAVFAVCALAGCGSATHSSGGGTGVELTYRANPGLSRTKVTQGDLDRAAGIMRNRLAKLGATGHVTVKPGSRTVVVRIDGVVSPREVQVLGTTADLAFYDLEPALVAPSITTSGQPVAVRSLHALLSHTSKAPARTVVVTCSAATAVVCPGDSVGVPPAGKRDYYLFKQGAYARDTYGPYPNLTGAEVNLSDTRQDLDPATGAPIVLLSFKDRGNKAFARVTRNEARRGAVAREPQHFAIVLDNEIRSWPQIDYRLYPNGIDPTGAGAQITGIASLKEAQNLALVVQTGALPIKLSLVSRRAIG